MTTREAEPCPQCQSKNTVTGVVVYRSGFRPDGLKTFSLSLSIPEARLERHATACIDCGMAWEQVDREELKRIIQQVGSDELKERLGLGEV